MKKGGTVINVTELSEVGRELRSHVLWGNYAHVPQVLSLHTLEPILHKRSLLTATREVPHVPQIRKTCMLH